jgi:hypothetical protein
MSDISVDSRPQESPRSLISELFDHRRLVIFLGIFLLELAVFALGLLTPLPRPTQQSLSNDTSTLFSGVQSAGPAQLVVFIFSHNLVIALLEMIPLLGALVLMISIYSTGLAAQVIALTHGYPGQLGAALLLYPYSFLELSAYALAVGAGLMLILSWRKGEFARELRVFVLEMLFIGAVLIIAAAMETVTRFFPTIGLALWMPTVVALAVVTILRRGI